MSWTPLAGWGLRAEGLTEVGAREADWPEMAGYFFSFTVLHRVLNFSNSSGV